MKRIMTALAALGLAMALGAQTPTDIYLLIGQSNMEGCGLLSAKNRVCTERVVKWDAEKGEWAEAVEPIGPFSGAGLGASFARAMADAHPDAVVGLVPAAVGGTPLARWMPGKDLYGRAVKLTRDSLAKGGKLKGILWHQGCSDAGSIDTAINYAARLKVMVEGFRKDLNALDAPFVAGELGHYLEKQPSVPHWRVVNGQLHVAVKEIPNTKAVSAYGLNHKGDILHFDTASLRILGIRYASTLLAPDVGRWHGANLLGMFNANPKKKDARVAGEFKEEYFRWMKEWGFNFARLPMDYRYFLATNDWTRLKLEGFAKVDKAVEWGRKYGVHVQICLHRAPGFTILSWDPDIGRLQTDPEPQAAFLRIWSEFARRYNGIPNTELSFNPVNEPAGFSEEQFIDVFGRTIKAIRAQDPGRFVMLDGNRVASTPVPYFYSDPLTGQAFRGYTPHAISHYLAWYIKLQPPTEPTWPLSPEMAKDRAWIYEQPEKTFAKYGEPRKFGYPVMIGEFGCYNKLKHETCLAWMEDCLKLWKEHGLGWAIWNVDGAFGFLDSNRNDVEYENFHGHKLDRKMLELLKKYK